MRPSLLCSTAPLARSTATCFRGPLCPYLAAGRCMSSQVPVQAPYYANSPNACAATGVETLFSGTCTAASPKYFHFPATAALPHQEDSTADLQLRSNEHLDILHMCAATDVESLSPSACTVASPEYHQSQGSTSFTQKAKNTTGLPLGINVLPAQSWTSSGSRLTRDKNSQFDSRPPKPVALAQFASQANWQGSHCRPQVAPPRSKISHQRP